MIFMNMNPYDLGFREAVNFNFFFFNYSDGVQRIKEIK